MVYVLTLLVKKSSMLYTSFSNSIGNQMSKEISVTWYAHTFDILGELILDWTLNFDTKTPKSLPGGKL